MDTVHYRGLLTSEEREKVANIMGLIIEETLTEDEPKTLRDYLELSESAFIKFMDESRVIISLEMVPKFKDNGDSRYVWNHKKFLDSLTETIEPLAVNVYDGNELIGQCISLDFRRNVATIALDPGSAIRFNCTIKHIMTDYGTIIRFFESDGRESTLPNLNKEHGNQRLSLVSKARLNDA